MTVGAGGKDGGIITVILAQAGIQKTRPYVIPFLASNRWIPACAGMTVGAGGKDGGIITVIPA